MPHLIAAAVDEFDGEAERLRLSHSASFDEVKVWADPELVPRALVAVLENAFAFSGDEIVELDVSAVGLYVHVWIDDRGSGVATELTDRLFQPLVQGDDSTTRKHQGLGIGLFLARRIMEAHGGRIDYKPRANRGGVFSLTFPAFQLDREQVDQQKALREESSGYRRRRRSDCSAEEGQPITGAASGGQLQRCHR